MPEYGLDPDWDVWVSGTRLAVSGPTREILLTSARAVAMAIRLGEAPPSRPGPDDDGPDYQVALGRLRRLRIAAPVQPAEPWCPPSLLPRSGLSLHRDAPMQADGMVLVVLDGDPPGRLDWLTQHFGAEQSWLPLRLDGPLPWAGPLFGPAPQGARAACPACLALRLRGAAEVARSARADPSARMVQAARRRKRPDRVAALLSRLDALLVEAPDRLRATILAAGSGGVTERPVVHGVCGCPADPQLESLPLAERVARLCDTLIGPAPFRVAIGASDDPIRVVTASQSPVARWAGLPAPSLAELAAAAGAPSLSSGVGPTMEAARLGAAMEAIESYAALWRGPLWRSLGDNLAAVARFADLPQDSAISPELLLCTEEFADPRTTSPLHWSRATELTAAGTEGGAVLVPLALVYDGAPPPEADWWESNGLGAGLTMEAAKAHALAELVERDAVAIWWNNAVARPRLMLPEDDGDPGADPGAATHRRRGRAVALLDLTHDLGVPARAALAWDPATGGAITAGFAADPDPARADRRALAESCLRLPALDNWRAGHRSGRLPHWFATGNVGNFPWLLAGPERTAPPPDPMSPPARLAALLRALTDAGLRPLIVDLLRPDTGIPVVKALVPGLRHTRNRFGPGRLYDVPFSLGWLSRPRTKAELLPFPEGLW
jgi:ribosomal protein S12 methylthiotransferase accessory factor YcaO